MSKKMTAALLIVSLTFNLAVLGIFLYRQFSGPEAAGAPWRQGPPPFREMGVDARQRARLMDIMRSFHRENRSLQREIMKNERALMKTIRLNPADSTTIDSLVGVIGRLREEYSRRAIRKLSEAGKILTEEQRGLLLDMMMKRRRGNIPGGHRPPWAP